MKIDLCKLLGVREGEEFKLKLFGAIGKYRLKNGKLEYYDDFINKWVESTISMNYILDSEIIKLPKKKQFSQDTLNFFKLVDKKWGWIARDDDGLACLYNVKPSKSIYGRWYNNDNGSDWCAISDINDSLFEQILCNEEPICIDDYVER